MKLVISDLTKRYGAKTAVDHVNLTLEPGVVGLLGPNGAGKTTMIRLLCDLIAPDMGSVMLDGENIRNMGEAYRDILGYLPQRVGYYPWFTGEKYLMYMAALKGLPRDQARMRTEALLNRVGLYDVRKKRLSSLSGGMIQRLGIAQAMLNQPQILILDEPTAGLDPQERIRFRGMIAELAHDSLVILSTHIVSDVANIASRVIMLRSGKVAAYDSVDALLNRLSGKVGLITVPLDQVEDFQKHHLVANMQPSAAGVQMRIVSLDALPVGAQPVQPNLEDAYLAYCGREGLC